MLQTKVVEKTKTHFMFSNFLPEKRVVYEIMRKTARQPTNDNIISACTVHAG